MHVAPNLLLCSALLLAMNGLALAADNTRGAVDLSGGNVVSQNPSLPKLHLNDAQRERIRQALLTKDTEVEFRTAVVRVFAGNFRGWRADVLWTRLQSAVSPCGCLCRQDIEGCQTK